MNPVLALVIANIIWGAASPIFKFSLENIPPFTLAFIRFFFAGLILLPFVEHHWQKLDWKTLGIICLGAFFGITVNISFYFLALVRTASINAPIIASAQPLFLYLFAIFVLRERPRKRVLTGILLSFAGVMTIILSPFFMNGGTPLAAKETEVLGNLFLVIATMGVIGNVLVFKKVLKQTNPFQVAFISFLFGSLTFLPFAMNELRTWSLASLNGHGWTGIIFGVFFSSALAYSLFIYGISKIEAEEVGIFTYIDPVVAVLLAIPLLNEYPTIFFYLGTMFVFVGILVAEGRIHYHPLHRLRRKK